MNKERFTILVYIEKEICILNRMSLVFSRRKITFESISLSQSEIDGVYKYIIVVTEDENIVKNLVLQLNKQVDIINTSYHSESDLIYQEIALYKLKRNKMVTYGKAKEIIKAHNAKVLIAEDGFTVFIKTGSSEDTQRLFYALEPFGILEFTRSGRAVISRLKEDIFINI